jgi:hypothetical protein
VQADPMKPKLQPPGTKRLKVKCNMLLSAPAFKFNLRHYAEVAGWVREQIGAPPSGRSGQGPVN